MTKKEYTTREVLSWHKKTPLHSVLDSSCRRENSISFIASIFLLYLYLVAIVLLGHVFVLYEVVRTETILWLVIESLAGGIFNGLPSYLLGDKQFGIFAFISILVVIFIGRRFFAIQKARIHYQITYPKRSLASLKFAKIKLNAKKPFGV